MSFETGHLDAWIRCINDLFITNRNTDLIMPVKMTTNSCIR